MLKKKALYLGVLLALSTTAVVADETGNCVGGVCFVNLDKHKSSKGFEEEKQVVTLETPRFLEEELDKSITIVLDGETITVFPKSTYVMTEDEKLDYDLQEGRIILDESKLGDSILENVDLPNSEYYCENNTQPIVLDKEAGFYECV
ncbi:MAG TPA: hypothetical protein ENK82_01310 [Campylobacterales bacterium]|nr:hypothetical protein [Campylobacterales bacterium]